MLYYPVLSSGAATQYPLVRRTKHDVLLTTTPGGYEQRGLTGRLARIEWSLEYTELTDAELTAFETFFTTTQGGLKTFTFCDPLDNLLLWSEDPTASVWSATGLAVSTQSDASTGLIEATLSNSTGAACALAQTITLPPGGRCVYSCELASDGAVVVTLGSGGTTREFSAGGGWRRVWVAGDVSSAGSHAVSLQVPAGGVVRARHMQAELQWVPSPYKPSYGRSGVYPATRFSGSALSAQHSGPNRNTLTVGLTSHLVSET